MPRRHRNAPDPNHAAPVGPETKSGISVAHDRLTEIINNEWLGLGDTTLIPTQNLFDNRSVEYIENPTLHFLSLARDPKYFSFACKHLLNKTISPMQACILWELWHRPFPMLLGCRGLGKCLASDTLVATNYGFHTIGEMVEDHPVGQPLNYEGLTACGENGYLKVSYAWNNGEGPTVNVTTRYGYSIEGTPNHPVRVVRDDVITWVELSQLKVGDLLLIDRNPQGLWHEPNNELSDEVAYFFGLIVGDGCYTQRSGIGFTTADSELAAAVSRGGMTLWGKPFRKGGTSKYQYQLSSVAAREELFSKYGFRESHCENKCFPDSVLRSGPTAVAAFIRGLMDTDGTVSEESASCTSKSLTLMRTLQFCLSRLGIVAKLRRIFNRQYQRYYWTVTISGGSLRRYRDIVNFGLTRKRERLEKACEKPVNENLDLIPRGLISKAFTTLRDEFFRRYPPVRNSGRRLKGLLSPWRFSRYEMSYQRLNHILTETADCADCDAWKQLRTIADQHYLYDPVTKLTNGRCVTYDMHIPEDHSFISNGLVSHNSFLLASYILLRATLCQGCKIVIVGAGFRQSKIVFNYCESIWQSSPILRNLCGSHSGPRHEADRWSMRLGESMVLALPIGDGCLNGDSLVTLADRFAYISDGVCHNTVHETPDKQVWGGGKFRPTDEAFHNGVRPTLKVKTRCGYEFEGTLNHKMRICRNGRIVWCRADKMQVGDRILIDRSWRWHSAPLEATPVEGYALGAMIGDGSYYSRHFLKMTTSEPEFFMPRLEAGTGLKFKQCKEPGKWFTRGENSVDSWRKRWNMTAAKCANKVLPPGILGAPRDAMAACLRGLFDTDGTIQYSDSKGGMAVCVSFSNSSGELVRQMQYILLHFGIVSTRTSRDRDENWETTHELLITGDNARLFAEHIGFDRPHKRRSLLYGLSMRQRSVSVMDAVPDILEIMKDITQRNRIRKGCATKESNAVGYKVLCKRKSVTHHLAQKFLRVFGHLDEPGIEDIRRLANPDIFYDTVTSITEGTCHTYDMHVPDEHQYCANGFHSHNSKVRGERASILIADEFSAQDVDIFENVISGFAAVSLSPVEKTQELARLRAMKRLGIAMPDGAVPAVPGMNSNQTILSGTCYYVFNHAYTYWQRYKAIIESGGDKRKLEEIFQGEIPERFDHRDYAIMRIPVRMLPEGYMDDRHIGKAKSTLHKSQYLMEYGACWVADSDGFFRRTLIESCVVGRPNNPIHLPSCGEVQFSAALRGQQNKMYVMGVDPASENDNFSIVILEVWPDHRRIVYCWTTTRKRHKARLAKNTAKEEDFYHYVSRKIRDLCHLFPCARIALDKMGGGISVEESLQDSTRLEPGELPILQIVEDGIEKASDCMPGEHILELVKFASADWVSSSNHGLRLDLESKTLLFPEFDSASLGIALEEDRLTGRVQTNEDGVEERLFDTLEDCVLDIEELKEELASIVHTQVGPTKRDRWDTPEGRSATGKKNRSRKDRYSALLMANMAARTMSITPVTSRYYGTGGFAHDLVNQMPPAQKGHRNPSWYDEATRNGYGAVALRK